MTPTIESTEWDEMLEEWERIKADVDDGVKRLPALMKGLMERMRAELPKLENQALPRQETQRLAHTMNTMKSSIFEAWRRIG